MSTKREIRLLYSFLFTVLTVLSWSVSTFADIQASGGTIVDAGGYRTHTFTSSGSFVVSSGSGSVEYLIVGGGGGGGAWRGGGGGAGGGVHGSRSVSTQSHSVVVGLGGKGAPCGPSDIAGAQCGHNG